MKWIIRLFWLLLFFPLLSFTCSKEEGPGCHQHIDFTNDSEQEIIVTIINLWHSFPKSYNLSAEVYRDMKKGILDGLHAFHIQPYQRMTVYDMLHASDCLEQRLEKQDLLFIILDAWMVSEYSAEELARDECAVLEKRRYTLSDLHRIGTELYFE